LARTANPPGVQTPAGWPGGQRRRTDSGLRRTLHVV